MSVDALPGHKGSSDFNRFQVLAESVCHLGSPLETVIFTGETIGAFTVNFPALPTINGIKERADLTFVPLVGVPDVLENGILMLTRTNHLVFPHLGIRRRVHIARTTMTTTLISNPQREITPRGREITDIIPIEHAQLLLEPPDEKKHTYEYILQLSHPK